MKFWIDTANVEEIKEAAALGILDGVTTNPSLVSKTGRPFEEVIAEICEIVSPNPVSAEAVTLTAAEIVEEGRRISKIASNVVVKVPVIPEGLKAVKVLTGEGIDTNVTLCFSPMQALLAAKAGATYISPFIGRLDDIGQVGMDLVDAICTIYENYDIGTQVVVASIRHPEHVLSAALIGADISTIPFGVFKQLVSHPLTDKGIEKFLADWEKVPK